MVEFFFMKTIACRFVFFLFFCFSFKMGFAPCNAEQPLQGMELQEKETERD